MTALDHYAHLLGLARRHSRVPEDAEDLLHDALLEAIRSGRTDFSQTATLRWLAGTIRNLGAMTARGARRRRLRDDAWQGTRPSAEELQVRVGRWREDALLRTAIEGLPPALRRVAELALAGLDRDEIAWILGVSDQALRQRIAALRKRLRALEVTASMDAHLDLPIGLLRRALLPVVRATTAAGSHDPDGHLLVIRPRPAVAG